MNFIAIIPARYASTRFPGKPLADINGKPMIQHVYERVSKVFNEVYVATDDKQIKKAVYSFGGKVVMTSTAHKSGTDRCSEAIEIISTKINSKFDVIVNVQGDEPFINADDLEKIKSVFEKDNNTEIATLVKQITDTETLQSPNSPKVILNTNNEAIYFSRLPIPFMRNTVITEWHKKHTFYKHIGLYAYKYDILKEITKLEESTLEKAESLEQLRWIENSYKIKVEFTDNESISIDTEEDLDRALEMIEG